VLAPGGETELVGPYSERVEKAAASIRIVGEAIQLGAVAGRQKESTLQQLTVDDSLQAFAERRFGDVGLLSNFDRRRPVVEPDDDEVHA
jgi:hypothetical protein